MAYILKCTASKIKAIEAHAAGDMTSVSNTITIGSSKFNISDDVFGWTVDTS